MAGALQEGTVFAGCYRVVRCIAAGGMGAVYEVIHLGTHRRRALKVMHPHLFQNDEMRERFVREARITAPVESEYIVDVSDAGIDARTKMPFLVMELLQGEELGERLKRVGRFSPSEVVTYLEQTAMALDRTHRASIVHRDLKPANLFLTQREDGTPRIKILDFGIAKVVAESATGTDTTRSLGTPFYMAPEQFSVGTRLTPAADIYALGMMAYTLLVGQAYWSAEAKLSAGEPIALALVVSRGPVEPPVARAAAGGVVLPAGFDGWFAKATAVNPAERFGTATVAVRELGEVLGIRVGAGAAAPAATAGMFAAAPASGAGDLSTSGGASSTGQMATPAGALVPAASSGGGRLARVVVIVALGVLALGVGARFALRMGSQKPAMPATEPVQAASAPAAAVNAAATVGAASGEASAGASAAAPAESAVAAPSASATGVSSAPQEAAAETKKPTRGKKPAAPVESLLGRD